LHDEELEFLRHGERVVIVHVQKPQKSGRAPKLDREGGNLREAQRKPLVAVS
jgi:hypothetical protein